MISKLMASPYLRLWDVVLSVDVLKLVRGDSGGRGQAAEDQI